MNKKDFLDSYDEQMSYLRDVGWVVKRDGIEGITDDEGNFYVAPSQKDIENIITGVSQKSLSTKIDEGCAEFILVPSALPVKKLVFDLHKLYGSSETLQENGEKIQIKLAACPNASDGPVYEGKALFYANKMFIGSDNYDLFKPMITNVLLVRDGYPSNQQHWLKEAIDELGGQMKNEFIKTQAIPGWEIHLQRKEVKYIVDDETPIGIFNGLVAKGEVGWTPESWIMRALIELKRHKKVLDFDRERLLLGVQYPTLAWGCKFLGAIPTGSFYHSRHKEYGTTTLRFLRTNIVLKTTPGFPRFCVGSAYKLA